MQETPHPPQAIKEKITQTGFSHSGAKHGLYTSSELLRNPPSPQGEGYKRCEATVCSPQGEGYKRKIPFGRQPKRYRGKYGTYAIQPKDNISIAYVRGIFKYFLNIQERSEKKHDIQHRKTEDKRWRNGRNGL